jgi:glycosyl transferase family 25
LKDLRSYFDKVLVLTVPRLRERQAHVGDRLKEFEFEFFYGSDKNDLSDELIRQHYQYHEKNSLSVSQVFKPMNKGEIACALSHRMIYQAMVDNNWQHALVFEDDVMPSKNISELAACLSELPSGWELCYLGYLKNERITPGKKIKQLWYRLQTVFGSGRLSASMIWRMLPRKYSSHLHLAGFHDCTHAYAISLSAAKKLLAAQTPVIYRADNLLSALILKGELNAYAVKHSLFDQEIFSNNTHTSEVRDGSKISI